MGEKNNVAMPPEERNRIQIIEIKEWRRKANFCHKELEKASLGEGSNGVVGTPTTEGQT